MVEISILVLRDDPLGLERSLSQYGFYLQALKECAEDRTHTKPSTMLVILSACTALLTCLHRLVDLLARAYIHGDLVSFDVRPYRGETI